MCRFRQKRTKKERQTEEDWIALRYRQAWAVLLLAACLFMVGGGRAGGGNNSDGTGTCACVHRSLQSEQKVQQKEEDYDTLRFGMLTHYRT